MTVLLKVFTLLGGLAFFLYGMNVMSGGLGKLAGGSLERSLKTMTKNRFAGMALGAVITIAIQSSSAMTVMLVGLVNSGIMQLGQTIGVIMGSNIGTTLTPWILSLSGVNGTGWIQLLKPENFSPIIAFIGVVLIMMCKKPRKRDIGKIMVGFAVLMYGMTLMGSSVSGLENSKAFTSILTAFENPLLGVLVGAVVTGVIQSSAASVGILQTLAATGQISYGVAIPIIMGQNIGTCVTALISSIGVNKNARKVAVVHITFNLIGTVVCLCLFYGLHAIFHFAFVATPINAVGISAVHTIFNVFITALLCLGFFRGPAEKFLYGIVSLLKKLRIIGQEKAERANARIAKELEEFYEGFAQIRGDIGGILKISLLTAVQLTAFFLIPLCIFYAFGLGRVDILLMICAGAFVLNFTSFIPLPGAAAGAEIGFHTVFGLFFPTRFLSLAILLWRLLTFYLPILVGGIFTATAGVWQKAKPGRSGKGKQISAS